jgi:1,2-dihydroxy-3-keto-5-methylthiopentene dioxygenase
VQYIKAMRLFKDAPKWTPLNRGEETEVNDFRKEYVQSREKGFADGTALQAQAVN